MITAVQRIFIRRESRTIGPVTLDVATSAIVSGKMLPTDDVSADGEHWVPAHRVRELASIFERVSPSRLSDVAQKPTPLESQLAAVPSPGPSESATPALARTRSTKGLWVVMGAVSGGFVASVLTLIVVMAWARFTLGIDPLSPPARDDPTASLHLVKDPIDPRKLLRSEDGCLYFVGEAAVDVRESPGVLREIVSQLQPEALVHTTGVRGPQWVEIDEPQRGWLRMSDLQRECELEETEETAGPWPVPVSGPYDASSLCRDADLVGTWVDAGGGAGFRFEDTGQMYLQNRHGMYPGTYRRVSHHRLRWGVGLMVYNQMVGRRDTTSGIAFPDCDTLVMHDLENVHEQSVWTRYVGPPGPRRALGGARDFLPLAE